MAANISCPYCQRLLEMPAEYYGTEVRCPECGRTFVAGSQTGVTTQAPPPLPLPESQVRQGLGSEAWQTSRSFQDPAGHDKDLLYRIERRRPFKPAGGLGLTVRLLLAASILFGLAQLGSDWLQYQLAQRLIARVDVPEAELTANDMRQAALGTVHFLLYIATAVVFLVWFYRVHANLGPLEAHDMRYSSGWAVGYWFVPLLNLVRPVQVAQEIWRNSDPHAVGEDASTIEAPRNSALIGFWWAAWIIANLISNVAVRMSWSADTPEMLGAATVVNMIAEIANIAAALLCLAVVAAIDARQRRRADALSGEKQSAPSDQ